MATPETSSQINIQWHNSYNLMEADGGRLYTLDEGMWLPAVEGASGSTLTEAEGDHTEVLLNRMIGLQRGKLLGNLIDIHCPNTSRIERLLYNVMPVAKDTIMGNVVESSTLLLVASGIRQARSQDEGVLRVTPEEWGDIAFEHRDSDSWGNYAEGHDGHTLGVKDPVRRKETLHSVARAVVDSGIFSKPQVMGFRGDRATLHTITER